MVSRLKEICADLRSIVIYASEVELLQMAVTIYNNEHLIKSLTEELKEGVINNN
ncbi:MAG: hypothetical protein ACOH2V_00625 [Candidatus Saccharimonadaceae bacterium]